MTKPAPLKSSKNQRSTFEPPHTPPSTASHRISWKMAQTFGIFSTSLAMPPSKQLKLAPKWQSSISLLSRTYWTNDERPIKTVYLSFGGQCKSQQHKQHINFFPTLRQMLQKPKKLVFINARMDKRIKKVT